MNWPSNIVLQVAAYFILVQSCISSLVHSRSVNIEHSGDVATDLLEENKLEDFHNASQIMTSLLDKTSRINDIFTTVMPQFKSKPHPCEESREVDVWDLCFERGITRIKCKKMSVFCLSANNNPPRCKENYKFVLTNRHRVCPIVTSCTCRAWCYSTWLLVFNLFVVLKDIVATFVKPLTCQLNKLKW